MTKSTTTPNHEMATVYFMNETGNHEVSSVITRMDENGELLETIYVNSIFKKELDGIARTYIEFEVESQNTDDEVEENFDRDEELEELFADFQNKGLAKISEMFKTTFGIDVDLDAERRECRAAIREDIKNGVAIPVIEVEADDEIEDDDKEVVDPIENAIETAAVTM